MGEAEGSLAGRRGDAGAVPWCCLLAVVAIANAAIMTLELSAGALTARHLGQSLHTWTSVMGVVLAGMAVGHLLGGRLGDRYPGPGVVAAALVAAGALSLTALPLNALLGGMESLRGFPWASRILCHMLGVFLVPGILLGMVNPAAARLAVELRTARGSAVGAVYAAAAAGSIGGTYLTGFVLVPHMPTSRIFGVVAFVLAATGLAWWRGTRIPGVLPKDPAPPYADPCGVPWRPLAAPAATAFLSNAAIMVFELGASRIITRAFGHSLYSWTALIGAVLAGLTLGAYVGGGLADRYGARRLLPRVLAVAGVACAAAAGLHISLIGSELLPAWPWRIRLLCHVGAICVPASAAIGAVGPVAAAWALGQTPRAGRTLGAVYAAGATGTVAGTFVTGYLLVDWFAPTALLYGLGAFLAFSGWTCRGQSAVQALVAGGCTVALALHAGPGHVLESAGQTLGLRSEILTGLLYEDHSQYSWIGVAAPPRDPMRRRLILDQLVHSEVRLDDPSELLFRFWWVYDAALEGLKPEPSPVRMLMIGGGGYVFPRYVELTRPGSHIEVAEIDPAVTDAAFAAFGLPRDTRIRIHNMDGRNRIEDLHRAMRSDPGMARFDCIIGDSINQYTVPFQLTTVEFARMTADLLTEDGIYLLNTTERLQSGRFLAAAARTCRQVFPTVVAVSVRPPEAPWRDTFILVCSKQTLDLSGLPGRVRSKRPSFPGELLDQDGLVWLGDELGAPVLTDDFAPVDQLTAPVADPDRCPSFEEREAEGLRRLGTARAYAERQEFEAAVRFYRAAAELLPYDPEVRVGLAEALLRIGLRSEALEQLEAALEKAPGYSPARALEAALRQ